MDGNGQNMVGGGRYPMEWVSTWWWMVVDLMLVHSGWQWWWQNIVVGGYLTIVSSIYGDWWVGAGRYLKC